MLEDLARPTSFSPGFILTEVADASKTEYERSMRLESDEADHVQEDMRSIRSLPVSRTSNMRGKRGSDISTRH